jgi:5-methylcytosine-specific restriction protein A
VKARRRNTNPTEAVVELVKQRAEYTCERCGLHEGQQAHHRHPRKMGGTRRPEINRPPNLLWLHAECHLWVEHNRLAAIGDGMLIPDGGYPPDFPVLLHYGLHKLTDDGGVIALPRRCRARSDVWTPDNCDCNNALEA